MKKRFLYLPIILIEIYLIFTLILFKWGPYAWDVEEPMFFWPLVFLYMLALGLGYLFGIIAKRKKGSAFSEGKYRYNKNHIFLLFSMLAIISIYFEMVRNLGLNTLNPFAILARSKVALSNPTEWYYYSYSSEFFGNYGGKFFTVLLLLLGPFVVSIAPLTVCWFKELRTYNKVLAFTAILLQVVKAVSSGKNKALFDIVIYIGIAFIIGILKRRLSGKKLNAKTFFLIIVVFFCAIAVIFRFGQMIGGRLGGNWMDYQIGGYSVNTESALLKMTPSSYQGLLVYLSMYLTQGYQALSMITDMPWIPSWGIGHSKFLVEYISNYIGGDLTSKTFQYRLDDLGWGHDLNWHSLYLYIANDTGLIGVVVVIFLLGFLLGIVYYESLYTNSALSLLLLIQLSIVCLYIPANNIIFNHIGSFVSFYLILGMWILSKTTMSNKLKVP